MGDPGLPTSITAGVTTGHVANSITAHSILNKFDTTIAATSIHVPIGDGTRFQSRALLSTDVPGVVVNSQSGTSYTAVVGDAGKLIEMTNASANALTIPASIFSAGHTIGIRQYGAGTTTVTAGGGFTIRSRGGLIALAGQYAEAMITFRSATEGVLTGDLA